MLIPKDACAYPSDALCWSSVPDANSGSNSDANADMNILNMADYSTYSSYTINLDDLHQTAVTLINNKTNVQLSSDAQSSLQTYIGNANQEEHKQN